MTLGSLFDGIGGFPLAALRNGIKTLWTSDIDPACEAVTKLRFPEALQLGDITKIKGDEIPPVDIISGGSPCQDLSVAGKRAGLDGARSGLFMQMVRVISEMQTATGGKHPHAVLWENVPGAFSSNGGKDIEVVLDEFENLGFVVDLNVLDAQFMGVPQRRRRIYALCLSASHIAEMKTATSWSIITQMLTEILLSIWAETSSLSDTALTKLGFPPKSLSADGRKRRMRLFGIEGKEPLQALLKNWEETSLTYLNAQFFSDANSKKSGNTTILPDTSSGAYPTNAESALRFGNTLKWLKQILEESCERENSSTTSTESRTTTDSTIFGCAMALESINLLTALLRNSCPGLSKTASYVSTARKEFTNFAKQRQASRTLFDGVEWIQRWDDYLGESARNEQHLVEHTRAECGSEVLPVEDGLHRDSAEGGEAGQGTAGDAEGGAGRGCECLTPWDVQSRRVNTDGGTWPAIYGGEGGGHGYVLQGAAADAQGGAGGSLYCLPARPVDAVYLRGEWNLHDAQNAQAICFQQNQRDEVRDMGDKTGSIAANSGAHQTNYVCAFMGGQGSRAGGIGYAEEISPTLKSAPSGSNLTPTIVFKERAGCPAQNQAVCYPLDSHQQDSRFRVCEDGVCPTVPGQMGTGGNNGPMVLQTTCQNTGRGWWNESGIAQTLRTPCGGDSTKANLVVSREGRKYIIRRLTPLECERLQGFPDGWTAILREKKTKRKLFPNLRKPKVTIAPMPDSARYRMLGNSIAVPCAEYIMGRICSR